MAIYVCEPPHTIFSFPRDVKHDALHLGEVDEREGRNRTDCLIEAPKWICSCLSLSGNQSISGAIERTPTKNMVSDRGSYSSVLQS